MNIRSSFAKQRAKEIAARTGMTATQVVEDALRTYTPQGFEDAPPGLIEQDGFLVIPSRGGVVTAEEIDAAIEDIRNER